MKAMVFFAERNALSVADSAADGVVNDLEVSVTTPTAGLLSEGFRAESMLRE